MARTALDYLRQLQSLLPRGAAWNRAEDSGLTQFLYGLAGELARVDARSQKLRTERDTRFTAELLADHELDLGIPDDCSELGATVQERRKAAHTKLTAYGRQDKQYFIDLAKSLGHTISITEYAPDTFHWRVNWEYDGSEYIYFRSGESDSGDMLIYILGADLLGCVIGRYKPAHTTFEVVLSGRDFSNAFSSAFNALPVGSTTGAFWRAFDVSFDVNYCGSFSNAFSNEFHRPL